MELSFINLQNLVSYLNQLPRKVASPVPVERIGFLHGKTECIDRHFILPSVILVLNGSGILEQGGERFALQAPFMLWNWPGEYKRYRPTPVWDELYIGFNPKSEKNLKDFFNAEFFARTPYPIRHLANCIHYIKEMLSLLPQMTIPGTADRIDLLTQMILLEAAYPQLTEHLDPVECGLAKIAEHFHEHYRRNINLEELAGRHGMSYSTFQRAWRRKYPCTPHQYLRNLRNMAALDYLRDSKLSIGDIAAALGFNNQFYFSKFFRDMNGVTPTEYQKALLAHSRPRGSNPHAPQSPA